MWQAMEAEHTTKQKLRQTVPAPRQLQQRASPLVMLLGAMLAAYFGGYLHGLLSRQAGSGMIDNGVAFTTDSSEGIPHILHSVFIADPHRSEYDHEGLLSQRDWRHGCRWHNGEAVGWRVMVWNATTALQLVQTRYPQYLSLYQGISAGVTKSNIIRYLVLHAFGGLYLDGDIDCWRTGAEFLEGADLVMQRTWHTEGVTNAVMASRPGLKFWLDVLALLTVRTRAGIKNFVAAGPVCVRDSLQAAGLPTVRGNFTQTYNRVPGVGLSGRVTLYPLGVWYHPCYWGDEQCMDGVRLRRANGTQDMTHLAGMHRHHGTWLGKVGYVDMKKVLCKGDPNLRPP